MKFTSEISRLEAIKKKLDEKIGIFEKRRDVIEDRAIERERDMTNNEQERYNKLDEQIEEIRDAIDNIDYAINVLDELSNE